jgi:hypothetical protein
MHIYRLESQSHEGGMHIDVVSYRKLTAKMLQHKLTEALVHAAVDMPKERRVSATYDDLFARIRAHAHYLLKQELTPIAAEKTATVWGWAPNLQPPGGRSDGDVTHAVGVELEKRGIALATFHKEG